MNNMTKAERQQICDMRKYLREENRKHTAAFVQISREQWPEDVRFGYPIRHAVWRSCEFMAQVFIESPGHRITVSRCEIMPDGKWRDGMTWDELQHVKNAIGFSKQIAVEIFPPIDCVVNVANMRHLWVFAADKKLGFGWGLPE